MTAKKTCPNCGRPLEKEVFTIGGKLYCARCKPQHEPEKTVALNGHDHETASEATLLDPAELPGQATISDEQDKTVALHETAPGDENTLALDEATIGETAEDERTVALGGTEKTVAPEQPPSAAFGRTSVAGPDNTRATTIYGYNKSLAATKVIKEMLKIEPDVDLEHASKIYLNRKGHKEDTPSAASINDMISRAAEETKYIFDKELGRGGMGAVFATVDQDIRRKVAMKVMLPGAGKKPAHIKRFLEEAQVTGQLEHPNIVPVHDIGIDENSKIYFTMKLVKGDNLETVINRIADSDPAYTEKYTPGSLIQIFMKVCDGISYAHSCGVLHRDLKPENIMVGNFGEAMVMDWGLAKVLGRDDIQLGETNTKAQAAASPYKTMEGQVMGTPSYMSPEQALGKISELDERSDIFSLGAILYKILTLQAPYKGKSARDVLEKARKRVLQPPDVRTPDRVIPPELNAICLKALAREKTDRYASTLDLKKDLQLYLDGKSVSAKKDNLLVKTKKWVVRNKVATAGIAAALTCLIAGMIATAFYEQQKKQERISGLLQTAESATSRAEYETAEETYFAVLGLAPHNTDARSGIARVSGKALAIKNKRQARDKIKEARLLFEGGDFIRAYDAYVATFALDPESPEARKGIRVAAVKAEKQKAQQKIRPLLNDANKLGELQKKLDGHIARLNGEIASLQKRIKGFEDFKDKKPLWDRQRELLKRTVARLRTEGRLISRYSAVLGYDGENPAARKALARLYYDKFTEAETENNAAEMAYYRELTLAFDDGTCRKLLDLDGSLHLTTAPASKNCFLFRFVEGPDRRMLPAPFSPAVYLQAPAEERHRNPTPGFQPDFSLAGSAFKPLGGMLKATGFNQIEQSKTLTLPPGSYLILVRKKGYLDTRIPLLIERGGSRQVNQLPLVRTQAAPPGFIYIPGGSGIIGGDPQATYAHKRSVEQVAGFLIAQHEVTVGQYVEFINYLEARLPKSAEKYLPRTSSTAGFYWKKIGSRYQADFPADWPVLGISWNDARAYCKWMTRKHRDKNWEFRMPDDREWEKAARGVDGRIYPWGNAFDYRFCSMANSHAGKRDGPDSVGTFPLDESVYGVQDMAGNISEWCADFFNQEKNIRINRGAAWSYIDPDYARCATRNGHSPSDVADFRGFRIALTIKK
ncbi:MAG: SUMF1/EgtB/PvdO family nonheme iron enzyme [Deltaproteobacteria bacterium]|nr:SUMF1/EgtB/PvdO family nonheme iron enzyme [Deltaproteobacteria bacterium]